jgi:hypothetical protein
MSNSIYCILQNAKAEDAQALKQKKFIQLPNDYSPNRTNIIIDKRNNVFWLVNDQDIEQCRSIAAQRFNQSIQTHNNLQSIEL